MSTFKSFEIMSGGGGAPSGGGDATKSTAVIDGLQALMALTQACGVKPAGICSGDCAWGPAKNECGVSEAKALQLAGISSSLVFKSAVRMRMGS